MLEIVEPSWELDLTEDMLILQKLCRREIGPLIAEQMFEDLDRPKGQLLTITQVRCQSSTRTK